MILGVKGCKLCVGWLTWLLILIELKCIGWWCGWSRSWLLLLLLLLLLIVIIGLLIGNQKGTEFVLLLLLVLIGNVVHVQIQSPIATVAIADCV